MQVDLRSPEGRELVRGLICAPGDDAGVFLTNFPASGWLSYDQLRTGRDDLVMLNVIGNHDGTTALDYTVNSAVGYPGVTGPVGLDGVVNHVMPGWDIACGQAAAVGLLAAERHRTRTGAGQLVTLALSDVALAAVAALGHVGEAQVLGTERERFGNELYGALGRDYATADGRRVIAVAVSPKQWSSLCEACDIVAEMAALADETGRNLATNEGDRFVLRDRIHPPIEAWCAERTLAEIREIWDRHGVCWGPYQSFRQLVDEDPRCSVANPMFAEVDQPGIGTLPGAGLAVGLHRSRPWRRPPGTGARSTHRRGLRRDPRPLRCRARPAARRRRDRRPGVSRLARMRAPLRACDVIAGMGDLLARHGTIVAGSRRAARFGSFGADSCIAYRPVALFNEHAIHIGSETMIGPGVSLSAGMTPGQDLISDRIVSIGDRCLIGRHSSIVAHLDVVIDDEVYFGPNVYVTDQNHALDDLERSIGSQSALEQPVRIGAGSWIGTNAVVLPGVTIGRGVAVGAGSVVTTDLPDYAIAVGSPARVVRLRDGSR